MQWMCFALTASEQSGLDSTTSSDCCSDQKLQVGGRPKMSLKQSPGKPLNVPVLLGHQWVFSSLGNSFLFVLESRNLLIYNVLS